MIATFLAAASGRTRSRRFPFLTPILLAGLAGCGSKEVWIPDVTDPAYPAQGKVVLPGGLPLKAGRIELIPIKEPGRIAYADLTPNGSYALQTRQPGDGAVPGDYKVRIMIPEKAEYRRLARYRDEDSSLLKVTIKPEPNQLATIQLK